MKKFFVLSLMLLVVFLVFPHITEAKDVYFTTARAIIDNNVKMADYYYDDTSIRGSKAKGEVGATVKIVYNGNLLTTMRLNYRYVNGQWVFLVDDSRGMVVSSMEPDVAARILFDYLP